MAALDVDSLRIELMREILDTEDLDVLRTVKRSLTRALSKVKERQVVEEELHANLQAGVSLGGVCGRYGCDRQ
ncbi:hypothetical protein ACPYIV_00940 [Parabacteroides sp. ASD2025]|uniref:hypothetical protein n=1 Tax=Parabacteroides sp. ASD2025 TaxID=3415987 RepID=UPI003CF05406